MKTGKFNVVKAQPLIPVDRATQQHIMPVSVPSDKFELNWIDYPNAIGSLFAGVKTNAGAEQEAPDGVTLNAQFVLGNGSIIARYAKEGHLVTLYVRFTIGSTTVINDITENGSGQHAGNMSALIVNLPFPASAKQPYAIGTLYSTETVQAADNSLSHDSLFGADLYQMEVPANARFVYAAASFVDYVWSTIPKAPAAYNANGFRYWSAGDYFEMQLEYETDYDG